MLRQLPWPRLFAEGIAIVLSILLAFWIQAWWESRQLLSDERAILTSLIPEFRQLRGSVEYLQTYNGAIRTSITDLLKFSQGLGEPLSESDIDRLLADLW